MFSVKIFMFSGRDVAEPLIRKVLVSGDKWGGEG